VNSTYSVAPRCVIFSILLSLPPSLGPHILLSARFSEIYVLPLTQETTFHTHRNQQAKRKKYKYKNYKCLVTEIIFTSRAAKHRYGQGMSQILFVHALLRSRRHRSCPCMPATAKMCQTSCPCMPATAKMCQRSCPCMPATAKMCQRSCPCMPATVKVCHRSCPCMPATSKMCQISCPCMSCLNLRTRVVDL
jgi:hypothetical protein